MDQQQGDTADMAAARDRLEKAAAGGDTAAMAELGDLLAQSDPPDPPAPAGPVPGLH